MKNNKIVRLFAFLTISLMVLSGNTIFASEYDCHDFCGKPATIASSKDKIDVNFNSVFDIDVEKQTIDKKSLPKSVDLTKDGYNFNGWYKGLNKYNFNTDLENDTILRAGWTKMCGIYYYDDAELLNMDSTICGNVPNAYEPKKEGYKFIKWIDENGNDYDNKKELLFNQTLRAVWEKLNEDKPNEDPSDSCKDVNLETPIMTEKRYNAGGTEIIGNLSWARSSNVSIDFGNRNIDSSTVEFFFKTTVPTLTTVEVYECDENMSNCSSTGVTLTEANKYYKTTSTVISLTVFSEGNVLSIAKACDKSESSNFNVSYLDDQAPVVTAKVVNMSDWGGQGYDYVNAPATSENLYFGVKIQDDHEIDTFGYSTDGEHWDYIPKEWDYVLEINDDHTQTVWFSVKWPYVGDIYVTAWDKAGNFSNIEDAHFKVRIEDHVAPNIVTIVNMDDWAGQGYDFHNGPETTSYLYFGIMAYDKSGIDSFWWSLDPNGNEWHNLADETAWSYYIKDEGNNTRTGLFAIKWPFQGSIWVRAYDIYGNYAQTEEIKINIVANTDPYPQCHDDQYPYGRDSSEECVCARDPSSPQCIAYRDPGNCASSRNPSECTICTLDHNGKSCVLYDNTICSTLGTSSLQCVCDTDPNSYLCKIGIDFTNRVDHCSSSSTSRECSCQTYWAHQSEVDSNPTIKYAYQRCIYGGEYNPPSSDNPSDGYCSNDYAAVSNSCSGITEECVCSAAPSSRLCSLLKTFNSKSDEGDRINWNNGLTGKDRACMDFAFGGDNKDANGVSCFCDGSGSNDTPSSGDYCSNDYAKVENSCSSGITEECACSAAPNSTLCSLLKTFNSKTDDSDRVSWNNGLTGKDRACMDYAFGGDNKKSNGESCFCGTISGNTPTTPTIYTVTFMHNGSVFATCDVEAGGHMKIKAEGGCFADAPTLASGQTFKGWVINGDTNPFSITENAITGNLTLYSYVIGSTSNPGDNNPGDNNPGDNNPETDNNVKHTLSTSCYYASSYDESIDLKTPIVKYDIEFGNDGWLYFYDTETSTAKNKIRYYGKPDDCNNIGREHSTQCYYITQGDEENDRKSSVTGYDIRFASDKKIHYFETATSKEEKTLPYYSKGDCDSRVQTLCYYATKGDMEIGRKSSITGYNIQFDSATNKIYYYNSPLSSNRLERTYYSTAYCDLSVKKTLCYYATQGDEENDRKSSVTGYDIRFFLNKIHYFETATSKEEKTLSYYSESDCD